MRFSPGFLSGAGLPWEEFVTACFYRSPEVLLSGTPYPRSLLQRSSRTTVVQFDPRKTVSPTLKAVMKLFPGKVCSWRNPGLTPFLKSSAWKQHLNFKKNLIRNNLSQGHAVHHCRSWFLVVQKKWFIWACYVCYGFWSQLNFLRFKDIF
jgi:hypothetical protein